VNKRDGTALASEKFRQLGGEMHLNADWVKNSNKLLWARPYDG
jgi:hypothetical protein